MIWLIGIIVVIAAELIVLVEVARAIGVYPAVALLLLISASGPWLVRRAGVGVWRRTRERVAAGQAPGPEALDGAALLVGGVLVCVPGFLTDIVGLALLTPPVRALGRAVLARHFTRRAAGAVIDVSSHPAGPPAPEERWLDRP